MLKVLLAAASLGTLLLVWKCARLLGRDPVWAIALVGLNPIVLVWGLGGDHNDFLMMFFIVLAFYLLLRARESRAGAPAAAAGPARMARCRLLAAALLGAGAAFVVGGRRSRPRRPC